MRKEEILNFVARGWQPARPPAQVLLKRRRSQHFTITVMPLSADNTLRFHLFDNTRRTVIADAELTLNAGNGRFYASG